MIIERLFYENFEFNMHKYKINDYIDVAKTFRKQLSKEPLWDFDSWNYEIFAMNSSIAFIVYVNTVMWKNEMKLCSWKLSNNYDWIHYWCEVDNVIFDFMTWRNINAVESNEFNLYYWDYIFERKNLNSDMFIIYIVENLHVEDYSISDFYKSVFYFYNNYMSLSRDIDRDMVAKAILGKYWWDIDDNIKRNGRFL